MACMCGDSCCPSCGPAQGNWQCPICRAWASEGCDHIDDETGELKPEFVADAAAAEREEAEMWDALAKELEEADRLADEFEAREYDRPTVCSHGNKIGECGPCDVAADLAYDAARESRLMGRLR